MKSMTDNRAFLNQKFESVQSLRGIAALFVLMQHICFIERGSFGVDIFFLISGFIMMYVTQKDTEHFVIKRVIRIIPLYYAMTFVSYVALLATPGLFDRTVASPIYLVKSLLFIPFSLSGVTQPLLRVGWTVNYEVLFYVLFFVAMKISWRYRAVICAGMLVVLAVIGIWVPGGMEPISFWTDSIILEFAAGMGLFYVFRWIYHRYVEDAENELESKNAANKHVGKCVACGLLLVCAGLFVYEWQSYESPFLGTLPQVVRWGIPSVFILCMVFVIGLGVRMPRVLVLLGNMSFSIYLLHYYPMRVLNKLIGNTKTPDIKEVLLTIVVVAMTLIGAWICYQLIEIKLTAWLRRKLILDGKTKS